MSYINRPKSLFSASLPPGLTLPAPGLLASRSTNLQGTHLSALLTQNEDKIGQGSLQAPRTSGKQPQNLKQTLPRLSSLRCQMIRKLELNRCSLGSFSLMSPTFSPLLYKDTFLFVPGRRSYCTFCLNPVTINSMPYCLYTSLVTSASYKFPLFCVTLDK